MAHLFHQSSFRDGMSRNFNVVIHLLQKYISTQRSPSLRESVAFDMYMSQSALISRDLGNLASRMLHWRHTGDIDRYWYVYRVSRDAVRSFSKSYPSYALRKHMCGGRVVGGVGEQR
jgi:hypothetical protein